MLTQLASGGACTGTREVLMRSPGPWSSLRPSWGPRLCSENPQLLSMGGPFLCSGADYGFSAPRESFWYWLSTYYGQVLTSCRTPVLKLGS